MIISPQHRLTLFSALGVVAFFMLTTSLFILPEGQQALVLELGRYVRTIKQPGVHWKLPFVQDVVRLENRLLGVTLPAGEVIASDQKRLVMDIFLRYRIQNPLRFYQAVRTERAADSRLQGFLTASLNRVMGVTTMAAVLSPKRGQIMAQIKEEMNVKTKELGIEVEDVRIVRTDLPPENSEAIFKRMNSERQREAQEIRSTGNEMARKIEAEADTEKSVILADAQKKGQILKGECEKKSGRIYAHLQGRDKDLYLFLRSLEAYNNAFSADDTTMVMVPGTTQDFFKYFHHS